MDEDNEYDLNLMNETCTAAEYTLQTYCDHLKNGRYSDAQTALEFYDSLVRQAQNIEDHTEMIKNKYMWSSNISVGIDGVDLAKAVNKERIA